MPGLLRRLREILLRRRLDREAAEELAHHLDLLVARYVDAGQDEASARRRARLELGSIDAARERIAEERTGFALEQLVREIGHAARVLRRAPLVSLLSVTTMGVGIGVSAVLFALVDRIVLRPLPYPAPERLVRIFDTNLQAGVDRAGAASGNLADWRRRTSSFDGIAGYYAMGRTLSAEPDAEVLITAQVSQDFFAVMGVPPLMGRVFTDDETQRARFNSAAAPTGADPVVVLSYAVWQRQFGGAPDILGRTLTLERRPFKVVGVMPPSFAAPDAGVRLWIPWHIADDAPRDQHYLGAVGRLKPGVSLPLAEAHLNEVAAHLAREYPDTNAGWSIRLASLRDDTVGNTATLLWMLLGAVGLVLLAACANVALLSLMRGMDRAKEVAVRLALGASAGRLLREFLLEATLLALAGGALGLALAAASLRLLPTLAADLPLLDEVGLDYRTLLFVAAVTGLSAIVSGVPQAWRRTRIEPLAGLSGSSPRTTDAPRRHLLRDAIVVGQVATSVILLTGSGLLVRTYLHLRDADPGFDPRGVLVAPVFLDSQAYDTGEKTRAYYRTLFERLAGIAGVEAVGGATTVPTSPLGPDFERPVWPDGVTVESAQRIPASVRMVTPGYFSVLGLRLAAGRTIDERDQPAAPRVVMINETLARRLWPGETAVGRRLVVDYSTAGTYPYEIIGVVGDVRFRGPRSDPRPEIYLPHAQRSYLILNVVIKSATDPRGLISRVRAVLKDVDPLKPAHGLYPLEELVGATYARERQAMVTLLVFAAAVTLLAVLGVYGVLSQRVRERAREIGIRVAMGANASAVMGWVARTGLRLMALGAAAGLLGGWVLTGALDGLLFGVERTDLVTLIGVVMVVAVISVVATVLPSWRASRIDPVVALRRG